MARFKLLLVILGGNLKSVLLAAVSNNNIAKIKNKTYFHTNFLTMMNNKKIKNNVSFCLAALLYLSFYLLSPFFHYHHEFDFDGNEEKYHSHLFADINEGNAQSEGRLTLDKNDEHSHILEFNAVVTTASTRCINIPDCAYSYSEIVYNELTSSPGKNNYSNNLHIGKLQKDKYVQSAGNVSPPLVSAA